MGKWLEFIKDPKPADKKTDTYQVNNLQTKANVGKIHWYGGFRKYVFSPNNGFIYDADCLKDIASYLSALMLQRKVDEQNKKSN